MLTVLKVWFSALYGINPIGSKALGGNPAQEAILQKLAWDTLSREPMNGLGTVPGQAKAYPPLPRDATLPPPSQLPPGFFNSAKGGKGKTQAKGREGKGGKGKAQAKGLEGKGGKGSTLL